MDTLMDDASPDHNRLVFLVTNDSNVANDLAHQVSHFGYQVCIFLGIDSLMAAMSTIIPAVIIIETTLADGQQDGIQAIQALQATRATPIPAIFLARHGELLARLNAVRAGGVAYLTRPIDIGSLIDQLDALTNVRFSEPYRILIVEDSRQLARYYTAILEQAGMVAITVSDPLLLMMPLNEFRPDLILMDVYMPGYSGLELAKVLRQQEVYLGIPIVFLSAETDLRQQHKAMSLGADDFLTKPIKPEHLVMAVASRAERSRALRASMVRDSLTGLFNHTATKEQLDREIARARRNGTSLALAMLDIDHFKQINDSYGHPGGDQVLKSLSRLLRQRLRATDVIGRYGGEEFVVILPDTDGAAAARVLDVIRDGFGQVRQRAGQAVFSVTFSCGVASFPLYGLYGDASQLIDAADRLLYQAKAAGRNRVLLATTQTFLGSHASASPPM
jgi:diguanylate cyclase (GGDEF)-like protein